MATKDKNTKDSSTVAIDYTTKESILTDKKVKVVPVYRNGGWLPQGHDGEFMFTGTVCEFDLPISMKTGRLVNILTKEEQAFFEKELFLVVWLTNSCTIFVTIFRVLNPRNWAVTHNTRKVA